jgi:cell division septal protein FtsQ
MSLILSPKRKRKKKLKLERKTYSVLGSVFVVLAGLAFLFFGSGVFKVESIDVQGANTVKVESLKEVVNSYLDQGEFVKKRNNIFLVRLGDLREDILEQIPKLKEVELKRNLFNGLLINITEKEPRGIYCTDDCYYFDQQGIIYEPAPKTKGFLILNISDQ